MGQFGPVGVQFTKPIENGNFPFNPWPPSDGEGDREPPKVGSGGGGEILPGAGWYGGIFAGFGGTASMNIGAGIQAIGSQLNTWGNGIVNGIYGLGSPTTPDPESLLHYRR